MFIYIYLYPTLVEALKAVLKTSSTETVPGTDIGRSILIPNLLFICLNGSKRRKLLC